MPDEQPKIIVEVPDRGSYSPIPIPQSSKLEEFKKGWINAIAFPDNIPDLAYDIASTVAIPALLSSCYSALPVPVFIQMGVFGVWVMTGVVAVYLYQALPEVKDILLLRFALILAGVLLGI